MTFLYYTLLAASSLPTLIMGAPMPRVDVYKMYTGDGQSTWPGVDQWWSSFDEMFDANRDIIKGGCAQFHVAANSDQETNDVASSIKQVSSETSVDARFILSVMLQESNGCVRAPTTNYGVRNPGLMQDHDGSATCNEHGTMKNPCPSSTITQMIRDGVAGTPAGDGLVQTLKQASGSGAAKYYAAARIYNSGSIDPSGDLGKGIATHCYSSDVANRLLGWVYSNKACSLDGGPSVPSVPIDRPEPAPKPVEPAPSPKPVTPWAKPSPPAATPVAITPSPVSNSVTSNLAKPLPISVNKAQTGTKAVSSKMAPGVTTECAQYYNIQSGDFCYKVSEKFNVSLEKLRGLNSGLDAGCSNLWLGYDYCVKPL